MLVGRVSCAKVSVRTHLVLTSVHAHLDMSLHLITSPVAVSFTISLCI